MKKITDDQWIALNGLLGVVGLVVTLAVFYAFVETENAKRLAFVCMLGFAALPVLSLLVYLVRRFEAYADRKIAEARLAKLMNTDSKD